ncbi:ribulose-phosphate 3-epimerase [Ligilactobacillus salivarius]|uniref:ribulose-phosphate 3-epimerase n=1 Tax=Ligilactobacillus salivarius TaxID=1624 RepID=UPI002671A4A6|nr:ribulose-phosphate 3-epimerase [Ligilactobacillus salivarius]
MREIKLCPSMMCANFSNLKDEVVALDNAGADIFHIDIMDGQFVPNFGMGLQDYKLIRNETKKLLDVHLMIMNPGRYIPLFAKMGANIIYFHPEADLQPARVADEIVKQGCKVGIALNPGTSVTSVKELLLLADYVLVMTVNPGFAGQKYLSYVDQKIDELIRMADNNPDKYSFEITVDGAISPEKIESLSEIGVKNFVLGTSALFGKKENYQTLLTKYKEGA